MRQNGIISYTKMHVYCHSISIKTLTKSLQSLKCIFLKPFGGGLGGVLWITVLLQNQSVLQFEVLNRRQDILLQGFIVVSRIHGSIHPSRSSRSWSCKTAPDHHSTTPMFYCRYDVPSLKYFYTRCNVTVMWVTPSKKFNFCHLSTEHSPKSLGDQDVFWQNWDESLFFMLSSGLCLWTRPCNPFLPSIFIVGDAWTP